MPRSSVGGRAGHRAVHAGDGKGIRSDQSVRSDPCAPRGRKIPEQAETRSSAISGCRRRLQRGSWPRQRRRRERRAWVAGENATIKSFASRAKLPTVDVEKKSSQAPEAMSMPAKAPCAEVAQEVAVQVTVASWPSWRNCWRETTRQAAARAEAVTSPVGVEKERRTSTRRAETKISASLIELGRWIVPEQDASQDGSAGARRRPRKTSEGSSRRCKGTEKPDRR